MNTQTTNENEQRFGANEAAESHMLSRDETAAADGAAPAKSGAGRALPADAMILIPTRNTVLFPGVVSPVTIGRPRSVAAAQEALRGEQKVGFLLQRDREKTEVGPEDLYWVGTSGRIVRYIAGQGDTEGRAHHLVVQAESRFRVLEFLEGWPFLVARVAMVEAGDKLPDGSRALDDHEIEARFLRLKAHAAEAIEMLPNVPDELAQVVQAVDSPSALADLVANFIDVELPEKQALLEAFDLRTRLDKVLAHLGERLEVLRISKNIGEQTKKAFDERQKEHVLREQMRQIQKELGDTEDTAAEIEELKIGRAHV